METEPASSLRSATESPRRRTGRLPSPAEAIQLTTITLGGSSSTSVALEHGRLFFLRRHGRAVIDVTTDRDACTNPLDDELHHFKDPIPVVNSRLDLITDLDRS